MTRTVPLLMMLALILLAERAEATPSIDLEGTWRYRVGDSPEWAQPEFDDSAWTEVRVPEAYADGPAIAGVVWYRRRVAVADLDPVSGQMAVMLGAGLAVAYELFVEGERVGAIGDVDGEREAPSNVRVWPLRDDLVGPEITIAVRTWQGATGATFGAGGRWLNGPFAVGAHDLLEARSETARVIRQRSVLLYVAVGLLLLGIAFFHGLVWLARREQRAYLWYAVFAAGGGLHHLMFVRGEAVWPYLTVHVSGYLDAVVATLLHGGAWEFVFAFFGYRRPRAWSVAWLVFLAMGVGGAGLLGDLPNTIATAGGACSLFGNLVLTSWRAIKGDRGARIVATGLALLTAAVLLTQLVILRVIQLDGLLTAMDLGLSPTLVGQFVLVGSMAYALSARFVDNLAQLDRSHAASRRFVPGDFLNLLGRANVVDVERGDATERTMTVLFADIRGFSTRSEKHSPRENFAFINRYLATVEPAIREHGGFVNQYYGDGIMALFGGRDDDDPEGAAAALRAASAMAKRVDVHGRELTDDGEPLRIGIGIHTGPLMLGTIGGLERLDTGVVGDAVNTASRIEALTKEHKRVILLSDATIRALKEPNRFDVVEVARVVPRGKREELTLFAMGLVV